MILNTLAEGCGVNAALQRKTNTYAKKRIRLQERLDVIWLIHNFVRSHSTTKEVPAVALGIIEAGISFENLLKLELVSWLTRRNQCHKELVLLNHFLKIYLFGDRFFAVLKKRYPVIRKVTPYKAAIWAIKCQYALGKFARRYAKIKAHCPLDGIYHCCTQKTGSVWVKTLLSDLTIFRYSGMGLFFYNQKIHEDVEKGNTQIPPKHIVTPMRINFYEFQRAVNFDEGNNRVFFIVRDPRDLIVSWYYSTKNTHLSDPTLTPELHQRRQDLLKLDFEEGLLYAIDFFQNSGRIDRLRSWYKAAENDSRIQIFKYEDLSSGNGWETFFDILKFCQIDIPEQKAKEVMMAYDFERLTGRKRGEIRSDSHLRGGTAGYWRKEFSPQVTQKFEKIAGDLVNSFGYER